MQKEDFFKRVYGRIKALVEDNKEALNQGDRFRHIKNCNQLVGINFVLEQYFKWQKK